MLCTKELSGRELKKFRKVRACCLAPGVCGRGARRIMSLSAPSRMLVRRFSNRQVFGDVDSDCTTERTVSPIHPATNGVKMAQMRGEAPQH